MENSRSKCENGLQGVHKDGMEAEASWGSLSRNGVGIKELTKVPRESPGPSVKRGKSQRQEEGVWSHPGTSDEDILVSQGTSFGSCHLYI